MPAPLESTPTALPVELVTFTLSTKSSRPAERRVFALYSSSWVAVIPLPESQPWPAFQAPARVISPFVRLFASRMIESNTVSKSVPVWPLYEPHLEIGSS